MISNMELSHQYITVIIYLPMSLNDIYSVTQARRDQNKMVSKEKKKNKMVSKILD